MEPSRDAPPLGAAELDRLEELLASDMFRGAAMRLDELHLYPADVDSAESDYGAWADGYLNGTFKDDVIKHGEPGMSAAAETRAMRQAAEDLAMPVLAIYDFRQAVRFPAQVFRRGSPQVGRNEPCPCGSGKKFKQCCADPKKLH